MKTLKIVICCIILISITGCDKNETTDIINPDVEEYIEQLKNGEYNSSDLPAFDSNAIPALLEYRNETQIITDFPINGISSFWMPECTLGMYVLWTIESIRAVAIDSKYLIGRFPSQNPAVQKREGGSFIENSEATQQAIANAYYNWWYKNKRKSFGQIKNIDPLENTDYRWH